MHTRVFATIWEPSAMSHPDTDENLKSSRKNGITLHPAIHGLFLKDTT